MAVDAIQAMKVPDTGFFLSHLTWYLGRGEIRLSTAQNHFKSLDRISYSKTGKRIPEDIKEPVFKVCLRHLTRATTGLTRTRLYIRMVS